MNLDACEAFVAVARERSFGKAARLLHVSPSAISVRLKALEDECGLRLLHREPHVSLTAAGEALLPRVETILADMREAQALLHQMTGRVEGVAAIGASQTVGSYVLPDILRAFQACHPSVRVRLQIGNSQEILTGVEHGYLDFGLVETPDAGRLLRHRWLEDALQLVMSPEHPLAGKACITGEDLQTTALLVREAGSGTRAVLEAAMAPEEIARIATVEVGSTEAIKRWLGGGQAVSFLSPRAVEGEIARGGLVAREVEGLCLHRWFLLVRRSEAFASTAAQEAFRFLRERRTMTEDELGEAGAGVLR